MTDKPSIRKYYLSLRLSLSEEKYQQLNESFRKFFFSSVNLSTVSVLHIFLPILSKKEPDTWLIIHHLKKDFPEIRISLPKMMEDHQLINYYFEDDNQIKENQWGIPEPQQGELTPSEKIDMVIVPLLAFDKHGHRLGYGKGYYDRFLATCRPDCKKIGLSFFDPIEASIPFEKTDIVLNQVITPTQSFNFY